MSDRDTTTPHSPETTPRRPARFARKLGFNADHQRLLDAVMRGKHRVERPA